MAKIHFRSVSYRNFMGVGNVPITIQLDRSKTTCITGKNGVGKSSMIEAITFGLFGLPFRDINKNQLINSINGKNAEVIIEFLVNGKEYKIHRGIKPNTFAIYENDNLLNQSASTRDYQKILEQQILRLNYKTFCQVVILGAASYTPFMQLKAAQRREVVEDILDIKIFSTMNKLYKDVVATSKANIIHFDAEIKLATAKVDAQRKLVKVIQDATDQAEDKTKELFSRNEAKISELILEHQQVTSSRDDHIIKLDIANTINIQRTDATKIIDRLENEMAAIRKQLNYITSADHCTTCGQDVNDGHREYTIQTLNYSLGEVTAEHLEQSTLLSTYEEQLSGYATLASNIQSMDANLTKIQLSMDLLRKENERHRREMVGITTNTAVLDKEKQKLRDYAADVVNNISLKTAELEEMSVYEAVAPLLKDTGVKTDIIREYLPAMNQLINKYLQVFDLFIQFNMDESFSEVIKSRHRDEFSYHSFSEGEKKKIDLAILLAWREVAKLKNSCNTNLLIFDEIMDGAMDDDSIEIVAQLLGGYDSNIFVISHRGGALIDKFHSHIEFQKINEFSVLM